MQGVVNQGKTLKKPDCKTYIEGAVRFTFFTYFQCLGLCWYVFYKHFACRVFISGYSGTTSAKLGSAWLGPLPATQSRASFIVC